MADDMRSDGWTSESVVRWVIPGAGLILAGVLVAVSLGIAPESGSPGFQPVAEISKACLSVAGTLVAAAIVSFLITEYWRKSDRAREDAETTRATAAASAERARAQDEANEAERRRLVHELRDVHHGVRTAALRMRAHKSVRTYGQEVRDVIIPKVAQLGGVIGDVRAHRGRLCSAAETDSIVGELKGAAAYLKALTNEFADKYQRAALLQEMDHAWRQQRLAAVVKDGKFTQSAPTEQDLREWPPGDVWSGHLVRQDANGTYAFPRLAILLEEPGSAPDEDDHAARFSRPIRAAMDAIQRSTGGSDQ